MSDNTTWLLPLEPIDERYTEQWYRWFPEVLDDMGKSYEVIDGSEFDHELEGEFFLDPIGTNYYKASQIQSFMERASEFEDGDEVFLFDVWHPGLTSIAYVRDMLDIDLRITGVLHAGTYDPHDLTAKKGMRSWGSDIEEGFFKILDEIFVATEFHKDFVYRARDVDYDKLTVTGLPLDIERLRSMRSDETRHDIVFTGRTVEEKGYGFVEELIEEGYNILVTQKHDLDKQEYYETLANAKAVFAPSEQETFGYGPLEGLALECEPIVPNRLAFQDTIPREYRYTGAIDRGRRIERVQEDRVFSLSENDEIRLDQYHYENVIPQMFDG